MNRLGIKLIAVFVITLGLLIPLALIQGVIRERTRYRAEARNAIAQSWTGAQDVIGPVLAIPPWGVECAGGSDPNCLFLLPDSVDVQATVETETRKRGLYELPVYSTHLVITGEFDLTDVAAGAEADWPEFDLSSLVLALGLTDNRGIVEQPKLIWGDESRELVSGAVLPPAQGMLAKIGRLQPREGSRYPFRIELELRGMETLQFAPVGRDTRVRMNADWPHPSFVGRFLPVEHAITDGRFDAEWRVSGLASGRVAKRLGVNTARGTICSGMFGVSLIRPADIYQQTMRSVKYGILFVLLTFTAFFLVEFVQRMLLHPMQYLLVGLALVVFFVLLLALSEHMAFGVAYLVASLACVGLVSFYLGSALGTRGGVASVTGSLAGLYAMLYMILISQDNALLMGSLLLFSALAAVMLVTRNVDWYRLGQPVEEQPTP